MKKVLLWLTCFLALVASAQAQFAEQRLYSPNSTGSANAQSVAISNYALNVGVVIRFRASYGNTGALTLNVNSNGAVPVFKQTSLGLITLTGGEIVVGQIAEVIFDGAQFELINSATSNSTWGGTSAGSANAQTVATSAPLAGQQITFLAGYTNTGSLTLNSVTVEKDTATGAAALTGGEVYAGNVVSVLYDATHNIYHLLTNNVPVYASATLASATTTDLGSVNTPNIVVTGSAAITSFGSSAKLSQPIYKVTFASSLTLANNNVSLILPGGVSIVTAANDSLVAQYLGSGNWQVLSYSFAAGFRAPQVTLYVSGSGTYPTPANALYLDVEGCGGGSGGGGSDTGASVGTAGGATTFGTLTANGGPAAPGNTVFTPPTAAAATGGDLNITGGLGGPPNPMNGGASGNGYVARGASSLYGQGGYGTAFGGAAASSGTGYCSGGGAGGYGANAGYNSGWSGNSGAAFKKTITSPASAYSYAIGAGGTSGAAGTNGAAGGNGASGFVRVVARFQ